MNKIAFYRKAAQLSQSGLGRLIGKTQGAIGNYETELRSIDVAVAWEIVAVLNNAGTACSFKDVFPEPHDCPTSITLSPGYEFGKKLEKAVSAEKSRDKKAKPEVA